MCIRDRFNTKFIEVLDGVDAGDAILLAPPLQMEEINLAGEVFGDDEAMTEDQLKPDAKALEKIEQSNRSRTNASQSGSERGSGQGGYGGFDRDAMMKRLDTDGDGKISDAEREAARKQFQRMQDGGKGRPQ